MSPLHQLAKAAGLQIEWTDAGGGGETVSDDSLRRVLEALGYPAQDEAQIARSMAQREDEERGCRFRSLDLGEDLLLPLQDIPAATGALKLEDGTVVPVELRPEGASVRAVLSAIRTTGYHRLLVGDEEWPIAIAPPRCFGPEDAAPGKRMWGAAVQVPALRGEGQAPFGEFGTLAEAAAALAAAGADALAISPVHALFPANADRFSPYGPSSRLFLNVIFGDLKLVRGPPLAGEAGELIDWRSAIPARLEALRNAFAARSDAVKDELARFRADGGSELERHAIFDALHAHFFNEGASSWRNWPAAYQDPDSGAVHRFAAEHGEEVAFFHFAQWLAREGLLTAQQAAKDAGMAIGLVADLAVGMDGGGSHAWSRPGDLLSGLSVGAPPDLLGPQGQDWGLTGFSPLALRRSGFAPFIATLRAALSCAGGIRIDHILGFSRLWVIPHGSPSAEGAYLTYPLDDLLRILAIESQRARAVVIGEDLGTVPEGLRPRLQQRGVLGMNVLWFERDEQGFQPPREWRRSAVAMTGTHDLPTVAGWWHGRDIDWAWRLGRSGSEGEAEDRTRREAERRQLWDVFTASGAASAPMPEPSETALVVDAAVAHVAQAAGALAIYPLEDIAGLEEQPNLPGTTDEHPNWRRRMPETVPRLLERPAVKRRVRLIEDARR